MSKLDDIKARLEAATPGPWEVRTDDLRDELDVVHDQEQVSFVASIGDMNKPRADADAELIANAPTDLARLVAAVGAAGEALAKHGNPPPTSDGTFDAGYRAGRRALRAIVEQYIAQALEGK